MKDFYTSNNRSEYYRDHTIAIDCVELHLINNSNVSEPIFLCTGGADITFDSPTAPNSGSNVYSAQGQFMGFSPLTEDFDVTVGKFSVYLSGIGTDYINKLISYEVEGKRVCIYKAFLKFTNNQLGLVDAPILMFDGVIYNFIVNETDKSCQITIDCASLFADFERTNGRKTNNWSNWLFQDTQRDTCFEKAGWVGQTEFKWGRL